MLVKILICLTLSLRSSSSYQGDGKSSRGSDQTPGSPDSRQSHFAEGDVSPRSPFCTGAEDPFSQAEDEQQVCVCARVHKDLMFCSTSLLL